jgi:hypothetical protein
MQTIIELDINYQYRYTFVIKYIDICQPIWPSINTCRILRLYLTIQSVKILCNFSRTFNLGQGFELYVSVKVTLQTCTKSNRQRNRTNGVEAVGRTLCVLRTLIYRRKKTRQSCNEFTELEHFSI